MTLNNIDNILKLNFLAAAKSCRYYEISIYRDIAGGERRQGLRRRQKKNLVFPRFFLKIAGQVVFEVRNG